jgi:CRISPR/Cas system-associated exonuclease Cas4 (RecB family)
MKKNEQLNLYVAALSKMFQLEWETATVALHFIRFGQVVPVNLRKDDVETFWKGYTEYLKLLDDKISEAEYLNSWPKEKGFQCKMCAFQPQCAGLGMGSFKGAGKGKSKAKGS